MKEREKRDRDREELKIQYEQGHDRASTDTTIKGKDRDQPARPRDGSVDIHGQRPQSGVFEVDDSDMVYTTSPSPLDAFSSTGTGAPPTSISTSGASAERAAYLSTSPNRSPMLTNQNDVDERLKKMNETFLKSLEGISGSQRRKDKQKGTTAAALALPPEKREKMPGSPTRGSSGSGEIPPFSRGIGLGIPMRGASDREHYFPYSNAPGLGLGLGRGRHASTSSSTLATSEVDASQGSEEVIGRMDLYEERRRGGY